MTVRFGRFFAGSRKARAVLQPIEGAEGAAPRTLYNLALVRIKAGDLEGAKSALEAVLKLEPNYPEALYNLGLVALRQDRLGDARDGFSAAINQRGDYPEAHYNLGLVFLKLSDRQAALASFREATRLREDYVYEWLWNPPFQYPNTAMPTNFGTDDPVYQQHYPNSTNEEQVQAVMDWLFNIDRPQSN